MEINEFVLKLQGKVGLPEQLELDHHYQLSVGGQIIKRSEATNQNGTSIVSFTFAPLTVEILDAKGKIMRAKDTSKRSQALRNRIFIAWKESQTPDDFPEFYEKTVNYLIANLDSVLTIPL